MPLQSRDRMNARSTSRKSKNVIITIFWVQSLGEVYFSEFAIYAHEACSTELTYEAERKSTRALRMGRGGDL